MEQQLSDLWNLNPTLQERTPKQIKFAWEDVARFHKPLDFLVGVRQGWWYVPLKHRHIMAWASPTIHLKVMFKTSEFYLKVWSKKRQLKHCQKNNKNPVGHIGTPIGTPIGIGTYLYWDICSQLFGIARPESFWWWRAIAAAATPGMRRLGISIGGWENAMHRISWWCRRAAWVECEVLGPRWARKIVVSICLNWILDSHVRYLFILVDMFDARCIRHNVRNT